MFNSMFDQLKDVKYFKKNNSFQESYDVKYSKEIKRLKSLQKEEAYLVSKRAFTTAFFVNIFNSLLFLQ